jgi:hypothetical protein
MIGLGKVSSVDMLPASRYGNRDVKPRSSGNTHDHPSTVRTLALRNFLHFRHSKCAGVYNIVIVCSFVSSYFL